MPKSDTWPGSIAMESLSHMNSAGSCDSVISMNSGYSEDSMEHLSAEERACLMYLEETIESLEVNEDSGLSTDEPESVLEAEKMNQMEVNDISNFKSEFSGSQKSDKAENVPVNETSEPQSVLVSAANTKETSADLITQPKLSVTETVTGCQIHPSATPTELCLSKDGDGNIKIVSNMSRSTQASEVDGVLIPPPSDFMDDLGPPPQPEKANRPSSLVTQEHLNSPPELSSLPISSSPQTRSLSETIEPRSPPAVAPKPKKLPPNIILKSHKAAVADGNLVHSMPTCSDRQILDAQKVHMEALRKLGLLKTDEADSGPTLSPKISTQTRRSWAAPSPPISPAVPLIRATTPSYTNLESPLPASSPLQSPAAGSPPDRFTAPTVRCFDVFEAPAAINDTDTPLLPDTELSAVKDVSGATVDAQVNTPPRTPSALLKEQTSPKVKGFKSATMERSSVGLSSSMAGQNSTEASLLRTNRPRPASLGSGTEFSLNHREGSQAGHASSKELDIPRFLPTLEHSGDSQKLPRSQGISVLICPRAENVDDRREALKRLGLLRD